MASRFSLVLSILVLVFACKKDDSGPAPSLTAGPAVFTLDAAAGNAVFNIISNQTWTVTVDQSWVTLSTSTGANDGIITASYTQNNGGARTATITVKGGGLEAKISLQQGLGFEVSTTTGLDPLGFNRQTFSVQVESGLNWRLQIADSSWLRCPTKTGTSGNSTLVFTTYLNFTPSERNNTIRFLDASNQEIKSLSIRQVNSTQANLLLNRNWSVYREIKTNLSTMAVTDNIITNPCETDDWVTLKEDSVTLSQGPVPCGTPKNSESFPVEYNAGFTTVSLLNGTAVDAYNILKLTTDSLIIENIPPYIDNTKAKRILVKKP